MSANPETPGASLSRRASSRFHFRRFSLRTFLITIVVIGGVFGILGEKILRKTKESSVIDNLRPFGASAEFSSGTVVGLRFDPAPSRVNDSHVDDICQLKDLLWLHLSFSDVTDDGVEKLLSLKRLRHVSVDNTKVTGRGVIKLAELPNLQILTVLESQISDELAVELKSKHPHLLIDEVKMIDGVRVGVEETAPNE